MMVRASISGDTTAMSPSPTGQLPGFFVSAPRALRGGGDAETPLLVEIPHAGLALDSLALASNFAPARFIANDADLYVDELYADAVEAGATTLIANVSRYLVDLNRGEGDYDGVAIEGGRGAEAPHGVIWHRTTSGAPILARPLTRAEYERRLVAYHRPYHDTLRDILDRKRARFGYAILLCAHSMPSLGRDSSGLESVRADVVPGTRGRTSAGNEVIDLVTQEAQEFGLSVRHDDPYRGGYSTVHYGDPRRGIHAVQVELARRLYMNETTLERDASRFARARAFCHRLVGRLATADLRLAR
jgi:N-formylglutamate deformylase